MSTLSDARMPSLRDKLLAQEEEQKKLVEKSMKKEKVKKLKGVDVKTKKKIK